jgi:TolB-like protein/tetratricopeptide (TPR) repeat protein
LALEIISVDYTGSDTSITLEKRSIAVMPFDDMSPGGDQAHFADGIAEELLNLLAKYNGLTVISRSSAFALRDSGLTIPKIAAELNVAHVLEGSVRKAGDRIRITVQLIDASTDSHLWSETYDREFTDVFSVQDEISARVVQELKVRLMDSSHAAETTTPAAYETYLRGLSLYANRNRENVAQAIALFEQVIELDPEYAPAYGSLASSKIWSAAEEYTETDIQNTAQMALDLDPANSDALAALGRSLIDVGEFEKGREALQHAIDNNPNNPMAHRWLALSYNKSDPSRYYALTRNTYAIDPLDPSIHLHLAESARMLGRYEDALSELRILASRGSPVLAIGLAAMTHRARGDRARELKSFYHAYHSDSAASLSWTELPATLTDLGEYELAELWIQEIDTYTPDHGLIAVHRARLAGLNRDLELAREIIDEAVLRNVIPPAPLAIAYLTTVRNMADGLKLLSKTLLRNGAYQPGAAADNWVMYPLLALALKNTGDSEQVAAIVDDVSPIVETQIAQGVINGPSFNHHVSMARLYALREDRENTLSALRRAASQGGLRSCMHCLSLSPTWDAFRDDPEFIKIETGVRKELETQRQQLEDAGMLLSPAELSALADYSFDPFEG